MLSGLTTQKCPEGVTSLSGISAVRHTFPLFVVGAAVSLVFCPPLLPGLMFHRRYEGYPWLPRGKSEASTKSQVNYMAIFTKERGPNKP